MSEPRTLELQTLVLPHAALCDARYALYLATENEGNPEKRANLEIVLDALHTITNRYEAQAIASDEIVKAVQS